MTLLRYWSALCLWFLLLSSTTFASSSLEQRSSISESTITTPTYSYAHSENWQCKSGIYTPRGDGYHRDLWVEIPTEWASSYIEKYRIQWGNGDRSPRYTLWEWDFDRKDNCGDKYYTWSSTWDPSRPKECTRRVWAYFTDHNYEIVCWSKKASMHDLDKIAKTVATPETAKVEVKEKTDFPTTSTNSDVTSKQEVIIKMIIWYIKKWNTHAQQVALTNTLIDQIKEYQKHLTWEKKALATALLNELQTHLEYLYNTDPVVKDVLMKQKELLAYIEKIKKIETDGTWALADLTKKIDAKLAIINQEEWTVTNLRQWYNDTVRGMRYIINEVNAMPPFTEDWEFKALFIEMYTQQLAVIEKELLTIVSLLSQEYQLEDVKVTKLVNTISTLTEKNAAIWKEFETKVNNYIEKYYAQ